VYVLNAGGVITRGVPNSNAYVLTSTLTVASDPTLSQPPITDVVPTWSRALVPFNGGKLGCTGLACADTKADWVGPYQLDLTCGEGTYSTLYGSTCWKCPANDAAGNPWNINLLALESDQGCWRVPYEFYGKATCRDGVEGQTAAGQAVSRNSRRLAVRRGIGRLFRLPSRRQNGDFLVTHRNASPLSKDSNTGCSVDLRWTPPAFPEPGLSGLAGVKDILFETQLFSRPSDITSFLQGEAKSKRLTDVQMPDFVKAAWQQIAQSPYNSEAIRTIVYLYIRNAANKSPAQRSAAETKLLAAYGGYIRVHRTFLAQQALNMYDAWQSWSDLQHATVENNQLSNLFYYGTVPIDFQKTLAGLAARGATGNVVVATTAGIVGWSQYVEGVYRSGLQGSELTMASTLKNLNLLKITIGGDTILTSATVINVAFAVLSSIAIDQFIEIKTARPKLKRRWRRPTRQWSWGCS
jgi:hypothetical protein